MANSTIGITPGTGESLRTDKIAGTHVQLMKLIDGRADETTPLQIDPTHGAKVEVSRINSTVPVSASSPLPVSGSVTVADGGGSVTVDGAVEASQGSPGPVASAWPVMVSDGVNTASLTNVGGHYAQKVDVVSQADNASIKTDKSTFTEGTSKAAIVGAVYQDSPVGDPSAGQAASLRMTQKKGLHVNLRDVTGQEIGTNVNPIRVDPTGITTQPVKDTNSDALLTALQKISAQYDSSWSQTVTLSTASAQTLKTPSTGKRLVIKGIVITLTTSGELTIFDGTSTDSTKIFDGTPPIGCFSIPVPDRVSSAVNTVLRWTGGASIAGKVTVFGYEI